VSEQDRRCGTCKFLQVPPDSAGRRVVRDRNYLCTFKPDWPQLPTSITGRVNFCLPTPLYVAGAQGSQCPVWEAHRK
jgi:hypothetical protein